MGLVFKSPSATLAAPSLGYLADPLYADVAAAFSVRNLVSTRTAPLMRVRRVGDDAERDITERQIYDGTLTGFANGGDCTVILWYNQGTGPNMDTAIPSRQPKVVSAGQLILNNGRLVLKHDGANDYLSARVNIPQPFTAFVSGTAPSLAYGYVFEARDVDFPAGADGKTVAMLTQLPDGGEDFYAGADLKGGTALVEGAAFSYAMQAVNAQGHLRNNRGGEYAGTVGPYGMGTIVTGANQNLVAFTNVGMQELLVFASAISDVREREIHRRARQYFGA